MCLTSVFDHHNFGLKIYFITHKIKIMKKFFLVIASLSGIIALSSFDSNTPINKKVLQSFHSEYGNPSNVFWTAYPHDDYAVFKQNDILVRVEYDLHGNQLYAIRY